MDRALDCFNTRVQLKSKDCPKYDKKYFSSKMNGLVTPPSSFVLPFQIVSHEILLLEIAALSLTHFSEQLVQPMQCTD